MNSETPPEEEHSSAVHQFLCAYLYPLHRRGIAPLVVAAMIGLGLQFVFHLLDEVGYRELGFIIFLSFILGGCVLGYVLHVVVTSAVGKDTPPDWQDISGQDGIVRPLILISLAILFSFGPLLG